MTIIEEHIVPENTPSSRFSDYAVGVFERLPSRKSVKKAIKSGALQINGEISNTGRWISPGMLITLIDTEAERKVYELEIEVIYEDDHLAIVNKPAGLTTSGNKFKTLENALPHNLKPSAFSDAYKRPRPVHRLDAQTSGLIIVAKTPVARVRLGDMLEEKCINKLYHAIVSGVVNSDSGKMEGSIEGKKAISHFSKLATNEDKQLSLLLLSPETGRTHQLRIHCSEAGFPILGDKLYGKKSSKGLFLCATSLQFAHPVTQKTLDISIELPRKFRKLIEPAFS